MDELFCNKSFEKATAFESGYIDGFAQFEVRWIRFHIASLGQRGEYEAATYVERGRRKERTVTVNQLVVIEGWGHPKLEKHTILQRTPGYTLSKAKFPAFAKEWDHLLDQYLEALGARLHLIVDGRSRRRLTLSSESRALSGDSDVLSTSTPQEHVDDVNSTRILSEGAVESLLIDRYERDPNARRACLDRYGYVCQVCDTTMNEIYGDLGDAYIHVHHKVPLSDIRQEYRVDPIRDLVPVCPNCHAMLHRSGTPLSVEQLREIVQSRRRDAVKRRGVE